METQVKQILSHLKRYDHITSMEAIDKYGITRLASCIFELRTTGHDIITIKIPVESRTGRTTLIAKYNLQKEN